MTRILFAAAVALLLVTSPVGANAAPAGGTIGGMSATTAVAVGLAGVLAVGLVANELDDDDDDNNRGGDGDDGGDPPPSTTPSTTSTTSTTSTSSTTATTSTN